MKRTILALALAAVMIFTLAACGSSGSAAPTAAPNAGNNDTPAPQKTYMIGICQLAPHVALDAATEGFMDALKEALPGQVEFNLQNAAGDSPLCATIVNGFVSSGVDLIMANATPALQAAAAATGDIPVLGTSVTEYGVALGIEGFTGLVGTNVSGTSDLAPLDKQADMLVEWFPEAKTVGLLYCSAEPNSQYQVDEVQKFLEAKGINCTQYPFSDTNDMASVTQNAADNSDVIYVPTDNTAANNTGVIDNICRPAGVPVIAGEEGICSGCGVATLSISYYDLGFATGRMAAKILKGEADVSKMPIEYAPTFTSKYNPVICEDLGLTIPEGYEAISAE
ncbi:MAG: ABC transporter substrate-binding protein [Clostridiales bacterium]|nr:ABC transporter substrate-binding protein [Clostridiales bacterium]